MSTRQTLDIPGFPADEVVDIDKWNTAHAMDATSGEWLCGGDKFLHSRPLYDRAYMRWDDTFDKARKPWPAWPCQTCVARLARVPAVVLGLSPRESRADNSDHKEVAMKLPIGPGEAVKSERRSR